MFLEVLWMSFGDIFVFWVEIDLLLCLWVIIGKLCNFLKLFLCLNFGFFLCRLIIELKLDDGVFVLILWMFDFVWNIVFWWFMLVIDFWGLWMEWMYLRLFIYNVLFFFKNGFFLFFFVVMGVCSLLMNEVVMMVVWNEDDLFGELLWLYFLNDFVGLFVLIENKIIDIIVFKWDEKKIIKFF